MDKEAHELAYWVTAHENEDGQFFNTHYERFYTDFFGLSRADYAGKRILDVGCGPRGSLDWIAEDAHADGIDPCANEYRNLNKPKMNLIQGNIEDFQPEQGYDFVTSFNSLDHVDVLDKAIRNIFVVLNPGGSFLMLSDIHREPTDCEPSAFDWDIADSIAAAGFDIIRNDHYEKHRGGMYQSLDDATEFDHENFTERYGIIAIVAHKSSDE